MKRKNQFEILSPEDRQFVLDLCEKHTYAQAAKILAEPRPVGLSFETGTTNLCRFYTRTQRDAVQTGTLGQYSRAIQMHHETEGTGHTEAVLALVQNRLLESLRNGKALADLTTEFRLFFHSHRAWLAETKWRDNRTDYDLERSWENYVKFIGTQPTCDFIRKDVADPIGSQARANDFDDYPFEDLDQSVERAHGNPDDPNPVNKNRAEMMAALTALLRMKTTHDTAAPSTHIPVPPPAGVAPHSANSTSSHQKPPAIPPIPPNSTSAIPGLVTEP